MTGSPTGTSGNFTRRLADGSAALNRCEEDYDESTSRTSVQINPLRPKHLTARDAKKVDHVIIGDEQPDEPAHATNNCSCLLLLDVYPSGFLTTRITERATTSLYSSTGISH